MAAEEHRRFKRLSTDWITSIRPTKVTDSVRLRMEQIKNISMGGFFVETKTPLKIGSVVELQFSIPGFADAVHARGVVRWSNDGSMRKQPVGMGVEFLDVITGNKDAIQAYIQSENEQEFMSVLTRSKLHQNLLRFYCRKRGENFPLDVLAQFLGCRHADLLDCLKDFSLYKLVKFAKDTVTFVEAESPEVATGIRAWYDVLDHGMTPGGGTVRPG